MSTSQETDEVSIPKQGSNPYLEAVIKKMREQGVSAEKLGRWIGVNPVTLLTKEGGFPRDPKEQGPFTKIIVGRFLLMLGIPPETFLMDPEKEDKWFQDQESIGKKINRDKYFTNALWNEVKDQKRLIPFLREVKYFSYWDQNATEELIEYYEIISSFFRDAELSISAHEILSKGDNRITKPYYEYKQAQKIVHNAILEAIEINTKHEDVGRRLFRYDRIFYLSRSERVFKKREGDRDQCLMAFISESSLETLLHIRHCLEKYRFNCRFRVTDVKSYRHHVIIDSQLVLTEDYVVTGQSVRVERLSIMDIDQADLGGRYEEMIEGHAEKSDFIFEITADLIDSYFDQLIEYLQDQLHQFRKAKDEISRQSGSLKILTESISDRIKTLESILKVNIDKREKYRIKI